MKKHALEKDIPKFVIKIYDCIFHQQVTCLINHNEQDYCKWLNKNKIKDIDDKSFDNFAGFATEYTEDNGVVKRLIVLPEFQWTLKNQGTLIHEITHVIVKIFAANNIPFNVNTQEFIAHSIGNMYEDIGRALLKRMKK